MINRVGVSPAFKSKVLVSGYNTFSKSQQQMVKSDRFISAFEELSNNGNNDELVNIVAEPGDERDLRMEVVRKTEKENEVTIAHAWLYKNNTKDEIVRKYNEMAEDPAIWNKHGYTTIGDFSRVSGKIANYLV